jgi:hypothetical protein
MAPLKISAALLALKLGLATLSTAPSTLTAQPSAKVKKSAMASAATMPAPDTGLLMGSFVSSRIDGKKLPMTDLASDSLGTQYVIEFAELVLALKANGEFRAALRYRQTLAAKGQAISREPLQRMTVYGSWMREGQTIRFVPDPKRGGEGLRILAGTATSKAVSVPFDYKNGRVSKRSTVLLIHDPRIF